MSVPIFYIILAQPYATDLSPLLARTLSKLPEGGDLVPRIQSSLQTEGAQIFALGFADVGQVKKIDVEVGLFASLRLLPRIYSIQCRNPETREGAFDLITKGSDPANWVGDAIKTNGNKDPKFRKILEKVKDSNSLKNANKQAKRQEIPPAEVTEKPTIKVHRDSIKKKLVKTERGSYEQFVIDIELK